MPLFSPEDGAFEAAFSRFAPLHEGRRYAYAELCAELASFMRGRARPSKTTVFSVIGGAAAGKTTLATNLIALLKSAGVSAAAISTDDFVVGDRAYRRMHFEGRDPLMKYDFELMNRKIDAVRENRSPHVTISFPRYEEGTGLAVAAGEEHFPQKIGPVDVLIVEGDFNQVRGEHTLIYLHMRDEDRLGLRVQRDLATRGEREPAQVVENFALRQRQQHLPYTFPCIFAAELLVIMDREFKGTLHYPRQG